MAHAADPATDPMVPVLARITRRAEEISGVVTFEMTAPHWQGFQPGQFNMLSLFGIGEIPISISGPPDDSRQFIHTIRDVGAVSGAMVALSEGDAMGLRGPFGSVWPVENARGRDVIVAAGGLGLAPVRPILYHLINNRDDYGKVTLLYGARSPDEILFTSELSEWRSRLDMGVEITVDHAGPGWHGHVGVLTNLFHGADFDPANTTAFVCGPEIMMRFAAKALTKTGVAAHDIHLSMERNMQCAIGLCGHCQLGPVFVCKDGPVFTWEAMKPLMAIKEL